MDELRRIFNRLNLILIGEAAIRFIDSVVFSICLPLWDIDGDGFISKAEANQIKSFPNNAFVNRNDIVSLDDLSKLAGYYYYNTFSGMTNLRTAHTGKKYSGNDVFTSTMYQGYRDCTSLERITMDECITSIERMCFLNCVSLREVLWSGNETSIGAQAFSGCTGMVELDLPGKMQTIGNNAFNNCPALIKLYLPPSITTIGDGTFYNCTSLSIDIDLPNLESIAGAAFQKTGVKNIVNLGKITTLPHNGYSSGPFQGCTSLETAILPSTLSSMGKTTFNSCTALKWVVLNAVTPPTVESNSFQNTTCTIYVPDASVEAYKAATNWISLANRIKPISEFKE